MTANLSSRNNTSWSQQGQFLSLGNTINPSLHLVNPPPEYAAAFGGPNWIGLFSGIKLPQFPAPNITTVPNWTQQPTQ